VCEIHPADADERKIALELYQLVQPFKTQSFCQLFFRKVGTLI